MTNNFDMPRPESPEASNGVPPLLVFADSAPSSPISTARDFIPSTETMMTMTLDPPGLDLTETFSSNDDNMMMIVNETTDLKNLKTQRSLTRDDLLAVLNQKHQNDKELLMISKEYDLVYQQRQFEFESQEHEKDRQQRERHHQDSMVLSRENYDWRGQLDSARGSCHSALYKMVCHSVTGTVGLQASVYIYTKYQGGLMGVLKDAAAYLMDDSECQPQEWEWSTSTWGELFRNTGGYISGWDKTTCIAGQAVEKVAMIATFTALLVLTTVFPKPFRYTACCAAAVLGACKIVDSCQTTLMYVVGFPLLVALCFWLYIQINFHHHWNEWKNRVGCPTKSEVACACHDLKTIEKQICAVAIAIILASQMYVNQ